MLGEGHGFDYGWPSCRPFRLGIGLLAVSLVRWTLALLGSGLNRLGLDEAWKIGNGPEIGPNKNGPREKHKTKK